MNSRIWLGVILTMAFIGGALAVVQISSLNTRLTQARDDSEEVKEEAIEDAEDAGDDLEKLEEELAAVRKQLSRLRRERRQASQAQSLEQALQNGTAEAVDGLSAEVSRFTCIDSRCSTIQGTATFHNDTQVGSAVTCMFHVEFEDGTLSHFSWFAEHVPPKTESVTDLYFASNHPSPATFWGPDAECFRGVATFNPGRGDI